MRILLLIPSLGTGGAERQLALLAAGLHARAHEVRVVALNEGGHRVPEIAAAGVAVEALGMRGPLDLRPAVRSAALRRFRPEVVMSSGVNGLYLGAAAAARARARHLYNEHRPVGVELSARRDRMMRLLARTLAGVIVVSPDQASEWVDRGVPAARVWTIPNGIAAEVPAAERTRVRGELGIRDGAVLALCVATLKPVKRVGDFLAAVRSARARTPALVGVVAGDGPDRGALADEIRAGGGPDAAGVRLLGLRDDVPRLMRAADLFVLPSDREAMPMAILEAMAHGLPVLATPTGAVPEMVGDAGVMIRPRDVEGLASHLVRLVENPGLRERLGAAGARRAAERWSAEAMVERYERVFREACAGAPRR